MAIEINLIRKPAWLRVSLPIGEEYQRVKERVETLSLHTVCKEAACPNVAECWGAGTATIMILGDVCTRGCRFCNVKTGNPRGEVDWLEPLRVAEAVRDLGWKYLVVTAVEPRRPARRGRVDFRQHRARDPRARPRSARGNPQRRLSRRPGGPGHRHRCQAGRLRAQLGNRAAADARRFATSARATISRCGCSTHAKERAPERYTKTSLMLGLGETAEEIDTAMDDARSAGVDIFTMGQYLQPSKKPSTRGRVRDAADVRAPRRTGAAKGLPPGRVEPALAQLLSRRASIYRRRGELKPALASSGLYS